MATTFAIGQEIKFYEWNGSSHDEFRGIIQAVLGAADEHPDVNLSYQDGAVSRVANNVGNIESFGDEAGLAGNDYWRPNIIDPDPTNSLPWGSTRPAIGDFVWLIEYDTPTQEEIIRPAIVRAVLGAPTDQDPTCNLFYVDPTGSRINVEQVDAVDDVAFPTTADYWADRVLGPGDEAFA